MDGGLTAIGLPRRLGSWTAAKARRLALWRSHHSAAGAQRLIVVVALEPVSADRFFEAVTASLRRSGTREKPLQFWVTRASAAQTEQRLVGKQAVPTIIVAELDRWLPELERCDVLYLRPGLLNLKDILPGIGRIAGAGGAPPRIECLDRLLSRFPTISLETLFYEPHRAAEYLNRLCGIELFEPGDFPIACEEAYRKAMVGILRIPERQSVCG